jgi:hypothetical protein
LAAELNILCATASQLNRSSIQESQFDASHIAGGISKFNTADNVMAIFSSPALREVGEYELQLLKTRSAAGVGHKITLGYDTTNMRISNKDGSPVVKHPSALMAKAAPQTRAPMQAQKAPSAGSASVKSRDAVMTLVHKISDS